VKPSKESNLAKITAPVAEIFLNIEKVLRAYRIYEPGHIVIQQIEQRVSEKLKEYLSENTELSVAVKPYSFEFAGLPVYENHEKQENFVYQFHQDGVRQLVFRAGLDLDQLHRFMEISRTDFRFYEYCEDDLVTLLWKAQFQHISYVVVETFIHIGEGVDLEKLLKEEAKKLLQDHSLPSIAPFLSGNNPQVRRRLKQADIDEIQSIPDIQLDISDLVSATNMEEFKTQLASEHDAMVQKMILVLLQLLITIETQPEFQSVANVLKMRATRIQFANQIGIASAVISV